MGSAGSPGVVADAGYWHKRQMEAVVSRRIPVLIPPDAALRKNTPTPCSQTSPTPKPTSMREFRSSTGWALTTGGIEPGRRGSDAVMASRA